MPDFLSSSRAQIMCSNRDRRRAISGSIGACCIVANASNQLEFIDETSMNTKLTKRAGWSRSFFAICVETQSAVKPADRPNRARTVR
jgi:hypothetical protein